MSPEIAGADQDQALDKIIIAVHGIGDQAAFDTIKSVAYRFFSYREEPAALPLGGFHNGISGADSTLLQAESCTGSRVMLAFTEAHWAPIPRRLAAEGHTLEETKRWAQTVVERFRRQYERRVGQQHRAAGQQDGKTLDRIRKMLFPPLSNDDFRRAKQVLLEMIEAIKVLERLMLVAEKAGLLKFRLGKLLTDYLGDVQVVTEFKQQRNEIISGFLNVLRSVHNAAPNAELYIVAHSEGSVISFLGLLEALRCDRGSDSEWVTKVRGYMTIGSPIDKHLLFWPELWKPFELSGDRGQAARQKAMRVPLDRSIQWKNYYDYGDPIGFRLARARDWLEANGWIAASANQAGQGRPSPAFDITDDAGFSRYWLPGKAHNDYWRDKEVFGHFIQNVVGIVPKSTAKRQLSSFSKPPRNNPVATLLSYFLPYSLVAVLSLVAVYVLRKGVHQFTSPDSEPESALHVLKTVGLNGMLLAGITVMAGIVRVTRQWRWRFTGAGLLAILAAPFWVFEWRTSFLHAYTGHWIEANITGNQFICGGLLFLLVIVAITAANRVSQKRPEWGLRPLLGVVGLPVGAVIAAHITTLVNSDRGPLWPLVLAAAGSVYLWWLALLLLGLAFIWHHYIRCDVTIGNSEG
jgi:hypothetical protein